ncbi:E3 ubiquitin-protein ligase rnf146-like isoform X1 [Osmerus eperlanus]|uniref:E3 ubiquitin-protein ligase rnf146-like isoform X1 n=2 Tax=Osmerus eperlanus TaxID=29151 RepID=UPI002E121BDD
MEPDTESMVNCGEVDPPANSFSAAKVMEARGDTSTDSTPSLCPSATSVPECAICLQSCIHPVRLPCTHIFCFLCVKGASWHSKRCALCRQEVPEDFLERPTLLSPEELKAVAGGGRGDHGGVGEAGHAWYYEGRNGWWQYDERTSRDLEESFAKGRKSVEMLIAGFLYVVDLENMVQYRRNEHGRRRRMKRDVVNIPKKGVAGLRLEPDPLPAVTSGGAAGRTERGSLVDRADVTARSQVRRTCTLVPPTYVRPPTVLGGNQVFAACPLSPSLEDSLSQLLISQPEGGEEEEVETASQASHVHESVSCSSEDEEVVGRGRQRGRVEFGGQEQRHGEPQSQLRESQPDSPPPDGSLSSVSARSRSPDGQCTVTEV